ncbi:hypothetical protein ASG29_14850 [Sphingomonas sp. Leaf412]|uniref:type II toxin-antitoxin system VapC family toxin n=1 Tax=Sphingomonas sp. Leaf412 TaxID=1736370 RepID=UPI0006F4BEE3|nr:type II toxin-antitoxin system VapC family toxin [Sphingomonas sp. Leaf412]KQT31244.1 hypothetical protein ASG29_14850 [Sphingomonas sp. Leaf412]
MILLDTHVLLWLVDGDRRLGAGAREIIEETPAIFFSAMSAWELAMLVCGDKLALEMTPAALLRYVVDNSRAREIAVDTDMALDAGGMPRAIHGDPCDRIIMATARALGCPLVTADRKILAYAAAGHLKAIDARI